MNNLFAVAAGGAIGAIGRYILSHWALAQMEASRFPLGTFMVNLIGCLLVGVLAGLMSKYQPFSEQLRLFLFVGLAGGFTTFSAFGLETFELIRRDQWSIAVLYVAASVGLGVLLVVAGFVMTAGGHR